MHSVAVLTLALLLSPALADLVIQPCDQKPGQPFPINITGIKIYNATWNCEKEPCVVHMGTNVTIDITFKNIGDKPIDKVENAVFGIFHGITVSFPGYPKEDIEICSLAVAPSACPIKPGDMYTERVLLPIVKEPFNISPVIAKWEMMENKVEEACFEVVVSVIH